ncbi:MAG: hypothetical protein AAF517_10275 [Planctomycetota bacterium]
MSSASIGDLRFTMGLDLRRYEAHLARGRAIANRRLGAIERRFAVFQRRASRIDLGGFLGGLTSARAGILGLGAALGVGGLGQGFERVLDQLDSIDKASSKLGVGVERLQEYRFAADQAGIASNTFDMALQRFTRRAAEAANGTGEARGALKDLGFTIDDLRSKSPEQLFEQAVAALKEVEDPAERLRLAFKLFDSEGAVLVNLVDNFEALRAKARELGVVIDRETIRKGVQAKDQLAAISTVISSRLAPSIVTLAPVFLKLGEFIAAASKNLGIFAQQFLAIENLSPAGIDSRIGKLEQRAEKLARIIRDELARADALDDENVRFQSTRNIASLNAQRADISDEIEALRERRTLLETATNPNVVVPSLPGGLDPVRGLSGALGEAADAAREQRTEMEILAGAIGHTWDESTRLSIKLNELFDLYRKGRLSSEGLQTATRALVNEFQNSQKEAEELSVATRNSTVVADELAGTLVNIARNSEDAERQVIEFAIRAAARLAELALQAQLTEKSLGAIGGTGGSSGAGIGGSIISSVLGLVVGGVGASAAPAVSRTLTPQPTALAASAVAAESGGGFGRLELVNESGVPLVAENARRAPNGDGWRVELRREINLAFAEGSLDRVMNQRFGSNPRAI